MKYMFFPALALCLLNSCGSGADTSEETTVAAKTPVEVVNVAHGSVDDELVLFATSVYLKRNAVTAPIPSFITQVYVKLGDRVSQGQTLYVLQSKESRALGTDLSQMDSSLTHFGIIRVKAPASGVITTLDKQQTGDYVLEGMQLCTIAESSDLAFQVNVPFEYTAFTGTGHRCTLILPDNTTHTAQFTKALTTMNIGAQTQTILAKSDQSLFLPENMIVKVSIQKEPTANQQILPKSCVLTDEMMQEFWVMQLVNDTTAIKVPVVVGNKNAEKVEIIRPVFSASDRIVSVGNYGLPEKASVTVSTPSHP